MSSRFWETTALHDLTPAQWESLCDGCGRCCLHKLAARDTGEVLYSRVACPLLDLRAVTCVDYPNRHARVPACVPLTPDSVPHQRWLPKTCAYRLVAAKQPLPDWHPLLTGDPTTVRRAGISVAGRALADDGSVDPADHLARWIR